MSLLCSSSPTFKMATGVVALAKHFDVSIRKASNKISLFSSVARVYLYCNKIRYDPSSSDYSAVLSNHFNSLMLHMVCLGPQTRVSSWL